MAKRITFLLTSVLLLTLLVLSAQVQHAQAQDNISVLAVEHDPAVLVKWMELLYDRVQAEGLSAPVASRLYAYAGITAYQSVLPGIPEGISLTGQLTSLPEFPRPDEGVYDWPASANAALSTVLAGLFPEDAAETQKAIQVLRDSQAKARTNDVGADMVEASTEYGDSVGQIVLDWSVLDSYAETRDITYDAPTGDPQLWSPASSDEAPVEPYWGQIRPFALYYADQCTIKHNMPFSSDASSTFQLQATEVKNIGDNLTDEQKAIANYWVDAAGETGTLAGHWLLIESQIIDVLDLKLDLSAMMYALVGTAIGDAYISAWSTKYQINLLRPESYIAEFVDPDWKPFLTSPNTPAYPSENAVVSAAAAEVLTGMFGTVAFTDNSVKKHGLDGRFYTSLLSAATEAGMSNLYGGTDYRETVENGLRQGQCVGTQILTYVLLRSVPQGE